MRINALERNKLALEKSDTIVSHWLAKLYPNPMVIRVYKISPVISARRNVRHPVFINPARIFTLEPIAVKRNRLVNIRRNPRVSICPPYFFSIVSIATNRLNQSVFHTHFPYRFMRLYPVMSQRTQALHPIINSIYHSIYPAPTKAHEAIKSAVAGNGIPNDAKNPTIKISG